MADEKVITNEEEVKVEEEQKPVESTENSAESTQKEETAAVETKETTETAAPSEEVAAEPAQNVEKPAELTPNVENASTESTPKDAPSTDKGPRGNFRGGPRREGGPRRNPNAPRREVVKEYEEKVVKINRVTKVVKGGKRMKFSALVVIGNKKGKYSFGTGKSGEVPDAIKKAVEKSKREIFSVQIVKGGTIAHEVIGKFGATTVFLKPATEGTGIIAGGAVRNMIELVGIQNVYSKVYGSRTPINVVRATHQALSSLKSYGGVEALRRGGEENA